MPTTKPRYTFTDTGEIEEMLDLAQRKWPDVGDRKALLVRLAQIGEDALRRESSESETLRRRGRQRDALERATRLADADVALTDAAWR